MIICDGCHVMPPWEHRCHGSLAAVRGERTTRACECPECNAVVVPGPEPPTQTEFLFCPSCGNDTFVTLTRVPIGRDIGMKVWIPLLPSAECEVLCGSCKARWLVTETMPPRRLDRGEHSLSRCVGESPPS